MKLLPLAITSLLLGMATSVPAVQAADAEVRFHPARQLWSHPLQSARQINAVVVHNTAIVNTSQEAVTVEALRFDVVRDGRVVESRFFDAAALDAIARRGQGLAQSGMLEMLSFQFAPEHLFGTPALLSGGRELAPASALYIPTQMLAFHGRPQTLRVSARLTGAKIDTVTGELSLRHGSASGHYRFPLDGRWFAGSAATAHSHHRWAIPEEFALDILRVGEDGRTHRGDGNRMSDFHAYGAPVLAAADGEVVAARDDLPDNLGMLRAAGESLSQYQQRLQAGQGELLASGAEHIPGNLVILRHDVEGGPVYSLYAHLKPGSVTVEIGTKVSAGTAIGALGGSGNSTEPHLHFHLCDAADALLCNGLPVTFDNIEIPFSDSPRPIESGDMVVTVATD
jgi:murein DD-endopeptidase MepM/ murein hydrolase activator NlpD